MSDKIPLLYLSMAHYTSIDCGVENQNYVSWEPSSGGQWEQTTGPHKVSSDILSIHSQKAEGNTDEIYFNQNIKLLTFSVSEKPLIGHNLHVNASEILTTLNTEINEKTTTLLT